MKIDADGECRCSGDKKKKGEMAKQEVPLLFSGCCPFPLGQSDRCCATATQRVARSRCQSHCVTHPCCPVVLAARPGRNLLPQEHREWFSVSAASGQWPPFFARSSLRLLAAVPLFQTPQPQPDLIESVSRRRRSEPQGRRAARRVCKRPLKCSTKCH